MTNSLVAHRKDRDRSACETAFLGIHPAFYSSVPNRVIITLLDSLDKPWSDEAVRLYIYALVSFGKREFSLAVNGKALIPVSLQRGEFICSLRRLSAASGRTRPALMKILTSVAVAARRTHKNGYWIYRLKRPVIKPPKGEKSNRLETPHITQKSTVLPPPLKTACPPKIEPHNREYNEREEREKKGSEPLWISHAAHDKGDRRSGRPLPLANCLFGNNPGRGDMPPRSSPVSKEKALRMMVETKDKIRGDHLAVLMQRYHITPAELEAAVAGTTAAR